MYPLPEDFVARIKTQMLGDADALIESLDFPVRTSVMLNTTKSAGVFENETSVAWCDDGRILTERPSFTLDPLFHAGCYYPQESSSMFLHHVLKSLGVGNDNLRALDLCASPGGKSIILSSFLGENGVLISNEIQKSRNHILLENLTKWGALNTLVTCNDPSAFGELTSTFDIILVDAPCSGEGMFRKDEVARKEWSISNTVMCSNRQKDILPNAVSALKPGGYLIYSTCTFAEIENEDILHWLIETFHLEGVQIPLSNFPNIRSVKENGIYGAKFFPHLVPGEGLFMAVLQKPIDQKESRRKSREKSVFSKLTSQEHLLVSKWINGTKHHLVKNSTDDVYACPIPVSELNSLSGSLFFMAPGIELGKILKNDFIPAQALAQSNILATDIPTIEVDQSTALNFLRGETIDANGFLGWCVVTFQNKKLGWLKCMSNRSNNYYPKHWRIRMKA